MNQDCLFCKFTQDSSQVLIVAESDSALAFLDINPLSKGHTVVIPKIHAETILNLNDELLLGLFKLVKDATVKLKEKLKSDGFNIGANMHRAAGQAVEHLHIHIIPRWQNDGGGSMHTIVNNPPSETVEEVFKEIQD